jgi:hypothetical protein
MLMMIWLELKSSIKEKLGKLKNLIDKKEMLMLKIYYMRMMLCVGVNGGGLSKCIVET